MYTVQINRISEEEVNVIAFIFYGKPLIHSTVISPSDSKKIIFAQWIHCESSSVVSKTHLSMPQVNQHNNGLHWPTNTVINWVEGIVTFKFLSNKDLS